MDDPTFSGRIYRDNPGSPPMNPAPLFDQPLTDLGAEDAGLRGIYGPPGTTRGTAPGVTAQFLQNAAAYHERYFDTSYWSLVLAPALEAIGSPAAPATILDIGSGSGNSIFPLAERFPSARIVATDVSPQLLAILRDFIARRPDAERFALVCVDATRACYREGVADLVVGAAILHHLLEPERVLAACQRALAPGCWAMFFEPFQAGNLLLALTYRRILEKATALERMTPGMEMLKRIADDYAARTRPRTDPVYRALDDKWMFTRTYLERLRRDQGWDELVTYALHPAPDGFRKQAAVHLRLGAGLTPDALPDWAWQILDETDAGMSEDLRLELALEGAVLLRKRA